MKTPERKYQEPLADSLFRCVWLLRAKGVRKALNGYAYDYVVKRARQALKNYTESR